MRIPPGVDVPLTPRVRRLIDTPAFRRLAQISQLGLVSLVYPAANHSRQEHSLGVFLAAIEYLDRLAADERFAAAVVAARCRAVAGGRAAARRRPLAVRPSDRGSAPAASCRTTKSWPGGSSSRAKSPTCCATIGDSIPQTLPSWSPGESNDAASAILRSMLSGPIDVDKIDYLMRDSLHAGVPYGRHFDRRRLIGSLCLNEAGDGLAITDKGKTAAEMMVFARYVMFSEVYWHHAVRAATAMLQRAFFCCSDALDLDDLLAMTEQPMIDALLAAAGSGPAERTAGRHFRPAPAAVQAAGPVQLF